MRIANLVWMGMLAVGLAAPPRMAAAEMAPGAASQFIRTVSDDAIRVLRAKDLPKPERDARFRALLRQRFDMPFIARFTLGRYWNAATAQQRDTYTAAFTEYVLQVYSKRLEEYAGETVQVISERSAGTRDMIVLSRVALPSRDPTDFQWRVREVDGEPRIIDVVVAGVSMVVTQRDEFAAVLQQRSVDGLIAAIRARTEELQKQG
jgi:phospholipid transport system substrate-binding protein